VISADARRFVAAHDLEDHVAKSAADAPELSEARSDALQAILLSPDATTTRARQKKKR
jgi:hypothetical protein